MHLADRFKVTGTVNIDGIAFTILGAYPINSNQVRLDLQLVSDQEPETGKPEPGKTELEQAPSTANLKKTGTPEQGTGAVPTP